MMLRNNKPLFQITIIVWLVLCLIACSYHQQNYLDGVDTTNLAQLENLRVHLRVRPSDTKTGLGHLRVKALRESALSLGAQGGLAWASAEMNHRMVADSKYLDTIFNFHAMVLSHGVIPPVLAEGDFSLNLDDPNTIRVADRTYKIVKQARFATTAPNWREYLWLGYAKPRLPNKTLLPRTPQEQSIWRKSIRIGWEHGIEQGHTIFQQNLARLKRDYKGMILYRKLLQAKMISPPFVARTELGVTGDGEDMRINDQVLRIVELPQLQTNTKGWKAIVVKR